MPKFQRGQWVYEESTMIHGFVLGAYKDIDLKWYIIFRASEEQLLIRSESHLHLVGMKYHPQ